MIARLDPRTRHVRASGLIKVGAFGDSATTLALLAKAESALKISN